MIRTRGGNPKGAEGGEKAASLGGLGEYVAAFLAALLEEKGYSAHTIRSYRADLTHFFSFLESRQKNVSPLEIRGYLGSLFGRYKRTTI
ncbi:MAG: site-specific integrase, partial [Deltaproteobacteria bacterium]